MNGRKLKLRNNHSGITLIALVISIIVMLILAGVSLNATIGDNGVITQASKAATMAKISNYLDVYNMNKTGAMIDSGIFKDFCINYKGTESKFLDYIPSIKDEDKENFEIIAGFLVYTGNDENVKLICENLGMENQYSQVLYDNIGKEFAYYVESWENAKANGTVPVSKVNNFLGRDGVSMAEFAEYANIPNDKYTNEFVLDYGYISYIGTDESRLMVLANSQYLRSYIASGNLELANYVAPEEGTLTTNANEKYEINDWIIEKISEDGSIITGAIIGYKGTDKVVTIPDTFNAISGAENKIIKITTIKGDGTNNIFKTSGSSNVSVKKVTVAKGISRIINKGLANLGNNIQCHILHLGSDLILGNDVSTTNVLGYEGIENTCGSFTFVVPSTGIYTFKLWGAAGGDEWGSYSGNKTSEAGLGGYSQGNVILNTGDIIYCYIGGKGVIGSSDLEDGSGGYNGGGAGLRGNETAAIGYGGGGATDIRFSGTQVNEEFDYRILVAAGGGGADNKHNGDGRSKNDSYVMDDGTGGYGGGTVSATDKSLWSGFVGSFDGYYTTLGKTSFAYSKMQVGAPGNTIDIRESSRNWCAQPGKWTLIEGIYLPSGKSKFFGEDAGNVTEWVHNNYTAGFASDMGDFGGGGGGYYGGYSSIYNNAGGAGGSAYADIEGTIKQVTDVQGYSGYENGNGAEMLGRYGNGKLIISK